MSSSKIIEEVPTPEQFRVAEFKYNGFAGVHGGWWHDESKITIMPYTAEFYGWTPDPGIAVWKCSDGKHRLMPTYALEGHVSKKLPPQPKTGVMFGIPCDSTTSIEDRCEPEKLQEVLDSLIIE